MWRPEKNKPISDKEIIGRRIFGTDFLNKQTSSKGKAKSIKLGVFVEDRLGMDLSVDRLSPNQPDAEVINLLTFDCEAHARTTGRAFSGWAALTAAMVKGKPLALDIHPTPIIGKNEYHADIKTSHLTTRERNLAALVLSSLADHIDGNGENKKSTVGMLFRFCYSKLFGWVKDFSGRFFS